MIDNKFKLLTEEETYNRLSAAKEKTIMKDNRQELRRLQREWDDKWEEKVQYLRSIGINIYSPNSKTYDLTKEQEEKIKYFSKELNEIQNKIKFTKDDQDRLLDKIEKLGYGKPKRENQRVFFLWIIWLDEDNDPYWKYHSTWETLEEAEEERYYIMNSYTVRIAEKAITPDATYFEKEYKKGLEYD